MALIWGLDLWQLVLIVISVFLNFLVLIAIYKSTFLRLKLRRMVGGKGDYGLLGVSYPTSKIGTAIVDFTQEEATYRGGTYQIPTDKPAKELEGVPFILFDSSNGIDPLPLNKVAEVPIKKPETLTAMFMKVKALAETKAWLKGVNLITVIVVVCLLTTLVNAYLSYTANQKLDSINSQVQFLYNTTQVAASNFSVVVK